MGKWIRGESQKPRQGAKVAETELTRREMIKLTASAAIVAQLVAPKQALSLQSQQDKAPLFFTREEFALVDELTELIIPADEHSPGARAAEVAAYIDRRLAEAWEEETKQLWRAGLKMIDVLSQQMHGKPFMQATSQQRIEVLARISANEAKPEKLEEIFFKELKSRTARAYYTSKIGIKTEMEYKGNVYLKDFVGYEEKSSPHLKL
jgi:hypothetical protein